MVRKIEGCRAYFSFIVVRERMNHQWCRGETEFSGRRRLLSIHSNTWQEMNGHSVAFIREKNSLLAEITRKRGNFGKGTPYQANKKHISRT